MDTLIDCAQGEYEREMAIPNWILVIAILIIIGLVVTGLSFMVLCNWVTNLVRRCLHPTRIGGPSHQTETEKLAAHCKSEANFEGSPCVRHPRR
jgi:hypothetical protein